MKFNKQGIKIIYFCLVILFFLLSFRAYAAQNNPDTNSDSAVHALMAYNLRLPEDLYYWGQDRIGSIVPILANLLLKITRLSPFEAISYVNYCFLGVGFLTFSGFLKNTISKLVFALIFFLPLCSFVKLITIAHPYAAQFACLGLTILLIDKSITFKKTAYFFLPLAGICAILSVWVSDFSLITILLLLALVLIHYIIRVKSNWSFKEVLNLLYVNFIILISFYLGSIFISYAKINATGSSGSSYGKLNSYNQVLEVISIISSRFLRTSLKSDNVFFTLHNIFAILTFIFIITIIFSQKRSSFSDRSLHQTKTYHFLLFHQWTIFFLINALTSTLLLIVSNWVYINKVFPKYFVVPYIFSWLTLLLFVENLNKTVAKRLTILLAITAILSSLSLPRYVYALEPPKSKVQQLKDIQTLGKAGFIGDYWSTYIISATNPSLLAATPHEQGGVRCLPCVSEVFSSKTIYLIKDEWLTAFPDRIEQFGWRLQKVGEPFIISGYTIAPYQRESIISSPHKKLIYFPVGEIAKLDFSAFTHKGQIQQGQIQQESGKILQLPAIKESNYVLFGPYVNLPEGIYRVSLKVRLPSDNKTNNFLVLADVHQIDPKSSQVVAAQKLNFNPAIEEYSFVIEFKANKDSYYEFRIATDVGIMIETPLLKRLK